MAFKALLTLATRESGKEERPRGRRPDRRGLPDENPARNAAQEVRTQRKLGSKDLA
jgi:hypothetical protein